MPIRRLIVIGTIVLGGVTVLSAQILIRQQAPTNRAAGFPLAEIEAIVGEMDADGRSTVRLLEGGSFNVNIRRIRSAETALMHPETTDVYVVREGSGTLTTCSYLWSLVWLLRVRRRTPV